MNPFSRLFKRARTGKLAEPAPFSTYRDYVLTEQRTVAPGFYPSGTKLCDLLDDAHTHIPARFVVEGGSLVIEHNATRRALLDLGSSLTIVERVAGVEAGRYMMRDVPAWITPGERTITATAKGAEPWRLPEPDPMWSRELRPFTTYGFEVWTAGDVRLRSKLRIALTFGGKVLE